MTSHKGTLEKCPKDELDSLIRWALRERVSGVAPSPHVWERIQEHVKRGAVAGQAGLSFTPFLRALVAWLLADTCPSSFMMQPAWRGGIVTGGYDLGGARALGQHHLVVRLAF